MAQHIGILHAGVPFVERPYFLPAKKQKEKKDERKRKQDDHVLLSLQKMYDGMEWAYGDNKPTGVLLSLL